MKKISQNKTVSIRIAEEKFYKLKELAREMSFKNKKDISAAGLMREAILEYLERRKK